jgi:uncharacterized protein DUF1553/uncharacterized protein DUF1549/cytochrome c
MSLALLIAAALPGDGDALAFGRDIRPILAQNCFPCHGPDEKARKAKLRLDRAEFAYAERDEITPIVPRDLGASEAWRRIDSDDPEERMPPPSSHRVLTPAQKASLRAWIEQGAPYTEHWAFVAPVRPTVPAGSAPAGAANPIDGFVRARLAEEGLAPARPAERATLARRLYLDLTGLPPGADEVAAFAADPAPDAYEKLVERLLASPHFGERMAMPWLDAARYADTNGFSIDGGRHAWLWRDYVIHAFNANKPYDRFLVEQLAGDLLPDRDDETLTATGFQRNSMITHEGGTIPEENLVTYGVDRVKTFGEAVLGLTLGCAQCHDHKFDPITQKDYYSLFAFFDQTSEPALGGDGGVNPDPVARVKSVLSSGETSGEEAALRARIAELEARLAAPDPRAIEAWEREQREALASRGQGLELHPVRLLEMSTPNTGTGFSIEDHRYARVERAMGFVAFDVSMEFEPPAVPITGLRVVMHVDPAAPAAGWGWGGEEVGATGEKKSFAVTNISVSAGTVASDQVNLYRMLAMRTATACCWSGENRPEGVLNTKASEAWIPDLAHEGPVHVTLTFAEPLARDATHMTAQVNFGRGGNPTARRMEFFLVSGEDDGSPLPPEIQALVEGEHATRTDAETATLSAYFGAHAPATERLRVDLANARERLATRTEAFATMVMDTAEKPRETFVLHRGNYADPREKVEAGTPAALPALEPDAPRDRLGLARWVVDPRNPLTARVAVNRAWQLFFGTGLVRTASDFGTQGEWPSHPELLDWLACEFRDGGWDVKRLVRSIVTSETYRQSSVSTPEALARDPDNRLLARGPRARLPAELVRDSALKIGGLLVAEIGGPSVNPYTPGDPWREISHYGSSPATAQTFHQDHGEKLYRRSLYTFWKRTLPPPSLALFDAPNREVCTFERASTNTPLQALVLLNDVQFVEAARAFAERILHRTGDDEGRLAWAFAEATARAPRPAEMAVLARALAREREHFAEDTRAAEEFLRQGESPRDASLPVAEHAAWSQVAALLLNLSETVTRN